MTIIDYATNLIWMAQWTIGAASLDEAKVAWMALTKAGYTTTPHLPSKKGWPLKTRIPESNDTWTFDKILKAVTPGGILQGITDDMAKAIIDIIGEIKSTVKTTKGRGSDILLGMAIVGVIAVVLK